MKMRKLDIDGSHIETDNRRYRKISFKPICVEAETCLSCVSRACAFLRRKKSLEFEFDIIFYFFLKRK